MMTIQLLIPILIFFAVIATGGAVMLVRAGRRQAVQARLGGGTVTANDIFPAPTPLVRAVEQVGQRVSSDQDMGPLRIKLVQAGYPAASAPAVYAGTQAIFFVTSLCGSLLLVYQFEWRLLVQACVVIAIVGVATLLPTLFVEQRARSRTRKVWNALPDAVDLLEICVGAGMGMDAAWNAVADEVRGFSPTLADEMALANLEMHLGATRNEALRNMARRTGADELNSLVTVLVQSQRFGTSMSQALRTFAESLRQERSAQAEEAAEKMAVKLLFPMVLFIFPVLLVVILGPAAIKIHLMFNNL